VWYRRLKWLNGEILKRIEYGELKLYEEINDVKYVEASNIE
jgi:hypothetical protein